MTDHADLVAALVRAYGDGPGINAGGARLPHRERVIDLCNQVLAVLLPGYFAETVDADRLAGWLAYRLDRLEADLVDMAGAACSVTGTAGARVMVRDTLGDLVGVRALVATDVEAAFANDPAAIDRGTIVLGYPSIQTLAIQRFAHRLYRRGLPILPRLMTEVMHGRTGIDIHPGAQIGESCFIDHGTGVVIGETSRIGHHCVLYQGVGLIAWNPLAKDEHGELKRGAANKRHPDLEDHVTVYSGASILGGDTVIGHHSVIGGNVWLTRSVEPYSVVTSEAPELTIRRRKGAPQG
jgi:serine O-acetyltransferase